jgi:hypothetical protein
MLETLVRQLNMVRLSVGVLALITMVGCTGLIDSGNEGLTAEQAKAKTAWLTKALPQLSKDCIVCHNGSRAGIEFLGAQGGDMGVRDGLIAFEPAVVNLDAPASSRLLTKGVHDGPGLLANQVSDILEWIRAEKDAQPDPGVTGPILETTQFIPAICTSGVPPASTCPTNDVDLTELGIPGAKIHFVAQSLGTGLYLNQLSLIGGPMGVNVEHPLFVSWPADGGEPLPDSIDRFFNVKMNLMANDTQPIAGGVASFNGFMATNKISIHFKVVSAYKPDTGGGGGGGGANLGCKDLPSFKANAQQLFAAPAGGAGQSCLSCHGGQNGNATSAMNITGVNSADDAVLVTACNQIKTRTNTTTPDQSGVFLAPDPANANHPFKFNVAQLGVFKNGPPGTGVLGWINAEKVAP